MAQSTRRAVYAVMTFDRAKGGYSFNPPVPARDENGALSLAHRLSDKHAGAVAFYRVGDPDIGEFDEPVILEEIGTIPYDIREVFAL